MTECNINIWNVIANNYLPMYILFNFKLNNRICVCIKKNVYNKCILKTVIQI